MYSSILMAQNAKLEKYTCIGNFTQANATSVLQKKLPSGSLKSTFSVNLYKINYKTTAPDGRTTSASGLVAMPISPLNKIGIVSYYHGTRITRTDIPSRFAENYHVYSAIFANSGGYMLVLPDYLGLGDSQLSLHPYMQAESLANSSIDMILAAKELAAILQYPINDELHLAGYSEGGLTAIVTYEKLLKNHKEIHVTAVAPGSGPYDWLETIQFMIKNPNPRVTLFFAYFFYAMQTYHSPWEGLDAIFKKPYATLIPGLLDGNHPIEEAFRAFSLEPHEIMQADFYDSIINGTNPATEQLITNFNHYDFKSTSPLMLIGTKGDLDIPFHGAEIAYQHLKKQNSNVYIRSVSDVLDHMQAMPYVMKEQLEFFNQYHH